MPLSTDTHFLTNNVATRVCACFFLGIVCDKPAQSVLQNMTDSGGFYGCGNCQVVGKKIRTILKDFLINNCLFLIYEGESVPAGKGHIRCFSYDSANPPDLCSNKIYDQAMKILKKVCQQIYLLSTDICFLL